MEQSSAYTSTQTTTSHRIAQGWIEGEAETKRAVELAELSSRARTKQDAAMAAGRVLGARIADLTRQGALLRTPV